MSELRLILLVAGLLFIAGIAGFEWWRGRRARALSAAPREDLASEPPASASKPLPDIHVVREPRVAPHEGVERVAEHRLRDVAHLRDVDQLLDRRMAGVAARGLGDVHREIAHTLEVGVDLDGRDDLPQVGRHRLVERQQREAAVVDVDVELVQRLVAPHDPIDDHGVAAHEALHGGADALLRKAAHLEQARLEPLELLLEVSDPFHVSP